MKEICIGTNEALEGFQRTHETYLLKQKLGERRNSSILEWLKTAPAKDVTKIWGEPKPFEGNLAWVIQHEPSVKDVSEVLHYRDDKTCFYYSTTHVRSAVFVDIAASGSLPRKVFSYVRAHP